MQIAMGIARLDQVLIQKDVFYSVPHGRLKLRTIRSETDGSCSAVLIFYKRPDQAGPKTSDYVVAPIADPDTLGAVLAEAYGALRVVCKRRLCLAVGNTSIHFDEVEGLGRFIELEVLLAPQESPEHGVAVATELTRRLQIEPEDLIEGAYADLMTTD